MANLSVAAGGQGVSGASAMPGTITGALGATYQDDGTLNVSNTNAIRRSVSRTNGTTDSAVFSETAGLRVAYAGVELDLPTLAARV